MVVVGVQPSFSRALVGSPSWVSTSARTTCCAALESARQPRRQIFRNAEDLSPANLARYQQSSGRQGLQVTPGGLMADSMAVLVGEHRVAVAVMTQGMTQQRQLAVIQPLHSLQTLLQRPQFAGLALQIGVEAADGLQDHLHLGQ